MFTAAKAAPDRHIPNQTIFHDYKVQQHTSSCWLLHHLCQKVHRRPAGASRTMCACLRSRSSKRPCSYTPISSSSCLFPALRACAVQAFQRGNRAWRFPRRGARGSARAVWRIEQRISSLSARDSPFFRELHFCFC